MLQMILSYRLRNFFFVACTVTREGGGYVAVFWHCVSESLGSGLVEHVCDEIDVVF